MRIGFVGLGKLGLPVAAAIASCGHRVIGYDTNPKRMTKERQSYQETWFNGAGDFNDYLPQIDNLHFGSLKEVCATSEIIFVAVQTPHDPRYEGITELPDERVDFDYSFLIAAVKSVCEFVKEGTIIAVISTCLPGTMMKYILPLIPKGVHFAYNPAFIAMGTVIRDFLEPEFVLLGAYDDEAANRMIEFYSSVCNSSIKLMSVESAELAKVAYNTYISFKIAFVNLLGEICHKIPRADVDEVTGALAGAYRRLISPAYLTAGMGDGGGCHPRDNIAMSYLAKRLNLSYDMFEAVMLSRERHARWLASMLKGLGKISKLPMIILGYAFKPGTKITTGSPALLVKSFCPEAELVDSILSWGSLIDLKTPAVFLLGCRYLEYASCKFPKGSIVIDPFRIVPDQEGVEVISIGKGGGFADV